MKKGEGKNGVDKELDRLSGYCIGDIGYNTDKVNNV